MQKKAKIITIATLGTLMVSSVAITTGVVLSIGSKKVDGQHESGDGKFHNQPYKQIETIVPDEIAPGVSKRLDKNGNSLFDSIRENLTVLHESWDATRNYILENEWVKFTFLPVAIGPDYFNGIENAKKFAKLCVEMISFTSIYRLRQFTILVTDIKESAQNAGYANGSTILKLGSTWGPYKKEEKFSDDAFILGIAQLVVHEWGHSIINNNQEIFDEKSFEEKWVDFLSLAPKKLQSLNSIPQIVERHDKGVWVETSMPFNNWNNWTKSTNNSIPKPLGDGKSVDPRLSNWNADNASFSQKDIERYIDEWTLMMQQCYTVKVNLELMSNTSKWLSNFYQDAQQVYTATNYNYFDDNEPTQAYDIMKALLLTFWDVDGIPKLNINHAHNKVYFKCDGGELTKDITTIKLLDASGIEVASFAPKHELAAIGFSKNPFEKDYQYKYVADTVWWKQDINFDTTRVTTVKAYDASGQEMQGINVAFTSN